MALLDFYVNPTTQDVDLTNSQLRLTSSIEECVRQKVAITLRTFRGEYFANIDQGVPYIENHYNPISILGKSTKTFFDSTVKGVILSVQGITNILEYNSILTLHTGLLEVTFTAITESGEVISATVTDIL